MNGSLGAELEMERRLERFAEVRLAPSPAAVARMRARVMREARLSFADAAQASREVAGRSAAAPATDGRRLVLRRAGALLAAACLTLGVAAGALAASQAGGPLYGPRVALEELALPADPVARATAEVARLEARMTEVADAAGAGNVGGVTAALSAYQAIADEAVAEAGANEAALATLIVALERHVTVLESVADRVPDQARGAIERTIERASDRTEAVIDRIDAATPPPQRGGPPAGEPAAERTPKPEKTPAPAATPKPVKPPAATTAEPVVTSTERPEPAATPVPRTPPPAGPPSERPGRTPPADNGGSKAP